MPKPTFTPEQDKLLRQYYKTMQYKDLAEMIGKTRGAVYARLQKLGLRKKEKRWKDSELGYIDDHIGRMPIEDIAKHLHRSREAVKIICHRKMHNLNQRSNIYTARAVQEELGLSCAKIVVAWFDRGYLQGERAPFSYGRNQVWHFEYDDIITCLKRRPWLVRRERMPEGYFRSIVQREWEKNPWYTATEAAEFLGLKDHNPVHRYIYQQLLPAVRRPMGGSKGEWIIRHRDLVEFQRHDPRAMHRKSIRLPETLRHKLEEVEQMAWRALAHGNYAKFGHYAGAWVQLSSIDGRKPAPFGDLVELARKKSLPGRKSNKEKKVNDARRTLSRTAERPHDEAGGQSDGAIGGEAQGDSRLADLARV